MLKKAPMDKSASSFDFMGFGTRFCARNAGVDFSYLYIATKWMTILYFVSGPSARCPTTVRFKRRGVAPPVGGYVPSHIAVLKRLRWKDNRGHLIRSLIASWGFVALAIGLVIVSYK
jgi:hypothetical protein